MLGPASPLFEVLVGILSLSCQGMSKLDAIKVTIGSQPALFDDRVQVYFGRTVRVCSSVASASRERWCGGRFDISFGALPTNGASYSGPREERYASRARHARAVFHRRKGREDLEHFKNLEHSDGVKGPLCFGAKTSIE